MRSPGEPRGQRLAVQEFHHEVVDRRCRAQDSLTVEARASLHVPQDASVLCEIRAFAAEESLRAGRAVTVPPASAPLT